MSWRPGTVIRNKQTGKPFKVLHSYKGATVVVDLEDSTNPTPTMILQERDYDHWVDERKMTLEVKKKDWFSEPTLSWRLA